MFDQPFRTRFSTWARHAVPVLARLGVTPDHITVTTFLAAVAAATLVAFDRPWSGLTLWLASRIGDGLDGVLARHTGRVTSVGGYLDITHDMAGPLPTTNGGSAIIPVIDLQHEL